MNKLFALLSIAALTLIMVGCGDAEGGGDTTDDSTTASTTNTSYENAICGKCGQEAAEACCTAGEACSDCPFKHGSELCCSGAKEIDGAYCSMCGFEKESEECCAEGAEKCEACSMSKGSPLCCKLTKEEKVD